MRDRSVDPVAISQVREAYDRLMSAFASADTDKYFDCFHEDASFVFPGEAVLDSRAAYRSTWSRWERAGLRFTDVVADDVRVRVIGAAALVTHRIETTVVADGKASGSGAGNHRLLQRRWPLAGRPRVPVARRDVGTRRFPTDGPPSLLPRGPQNRTLPRTEPGALR